MKKLLGLAIATLVLWPAAPARGANWVPVSEAGEKEVYVNMDSLKRDRQYVWFWSKVDRFEYYNSADCAKGESRTHRSRTYDKQGKLVIDKNKKGGLSAPAADSPQAEVIAFACSREQSKVRTQESEVKDYS